MNKNQNETTGRMMRPVAYIKSDFTSKFGIPRQSGLADLEAEIHFYPEYQNPEAVRGLEEYSHLWLIWEFSQAIRKEWSPTVRPPKLGGNTRVGVFATRSPFRPNPIGLSSVQLTGVTSESSGWSGHPYPGRRSSGRNPDLRHQTLHPLCRQPPRSTWKLRNRSSATTTFRYNSRRNS